MLKTHYVVDIDCKHLEVKDYSPDTLKNDMAFFNVDKPLDLQTNDRRIFASLSAAERFIDDYKSAMARLERIKGKPRMAALLLKRRWLPLTAMGLKTYTERGYERNWTPGQPIRFYDQTYCVEVILKSIEEIDGSYRYHYKLK